MATGSTGLCLNGFLATEGNRFAAARDRIRRKMDVNQVVGQLPDEYMRDIDIVRYDRSGNETRRCTLHTARVKVLEYDDLEGGNSQNSIEKLTICLQYWTGWQPHAICGLLDAEATALLVIGSAPRRGRIIVVARRCVSPATRRQ